MTKEKKRWQAFQAETAKEISHPKGGLNIHINSSMKNAEKQATLPKENTIQIEQIQ